MTDEPTTIQVAGLEVTVTKAVLFTVEKHGRACWDVEKREWIGVEHELAPWFKRAILTVGGQP